MSQQRTQFPHVFYYRLVKSVFVCVCQQTPETLHNSHFIFTRRNSQKPHWKPQHKKDRNFLHIYSSVFHKHFFGKISNKQCLLDVSEKNPNSSCAWNMLGILAERMGLLSSATKAFKHALVLAEHAHRDLARTNYGRLLYRTGEYGEAIEMFSNVEAATFSSGAGLALALFRSKFFFQKKTAQK